MSKRVEHEKCESTWAKKYFGLFCQTCIFGHKKVKIIFDQRKFLAKKQKIRNCSHKFAILYEKQASIRNRQKGKARLDFKKNFTKICSLLHTYYYYVLEKLRISAHIANFSLHFLYRLLPQMSGFSIEDLCRFTLTCQLPFTLFK